MHIIFGKDSAEAMREKFVVLELDTFNIGGTEHAAYCVVENIPLLELKEADDKLKLHENLLREYAKQNWNYCTAAIEQLHGAWGRELDSFYDDLGSRIQTLSKSVPDGWSSVIQK